MSVIPKNHDANIVKKNSIFGFLHLFYYLCAVMAKVEKDVNDMTFFEHLEELRPGLVRSVVVLLVAMVAASIRVWGRVSAFSP